jgi:hypothetical protein
MLRTVPISFRLSREISTEVDRVVSELGIPRSRWLETIIVEALGKEPISSLKTIDDRVSVLEARLKSLAG